jgi:hypothetical protein
MPSFIILKDYITASAAKVTVLPKPQEKIGSLMPAYSYGFGEAR